MKKFFSLFLVFTTFLLPASFASAHQREVLQIGDKQYLFVIGSLNEPVVVDDKTGVDLRVKLADPVKPSDSASPNAKPVTGLNETLKIELQAGGKKKTLNLEPAYNDPGAYRAAFYPTVATTYAYRVFGTLNNTQVDLLFSCNPAGHPVAPEDAMQTVVSTGVTRTFKAGAFGCPSAKEGFGFPEPSKELATVGDTNMKALWALSTAALVVALGALVKVKKS